MNFWRARVLQAVNSCPAPRSLQQLPVGGPTLLSLRPLQGSETVESVMLATNGISQAAQPALWQPYDAARADILRESHPAEQRAQRFPAQADAIARAVASTGRPLQALRTAVAQNRVDGADRRRNGPAGGLCGGGFVLSSNAFILIAASA